MTPFVESLVMPVHPLMADVPTQLSSLLDVPASSLLSPSRVSQSSIRAWLACVLQWLEATAGEYAEGCQHSQRQQSDGRYPAPGAARTPASITFPGLQG